MSCSLVGVNVEEPKYRVLSQTKYIEVRQYDPMIIAQVRITGERNEAANAGFRILADFIFGNNQKAASSTGSQTYEEIPMTAPVVQQESERIPMTAPVVQQESEKIPMTAPVVQQESEKIPMTAPVVQQESEKVPMTAPVVQQSQGKNWIVHFVMPQNHTLETLPKPKDQRIRIIQKPSQKYVVIRFSGLSSVGNLAEHEATLRSYIIKEQLVTTSKPIYAFYNPPWTLPFLRRNEIMFRIE